MIDKIVLGLDNLSLVPSEYKDNVKNVLDKVLELGIDAKLLFHPNNPVTSLQSHLDLYGGSADNVMKCLCFVSKSKPLVVIASGEIKVDMKKLSDVSGMKDIRMAKFEELQNLFGRKPGGVDPLTISDNIPVFVDKSFFEKDFVVGSGGCPVVGLKLNPNEIKKFNRYVVADLSKD